jgi:hypothetical protein
MCRICVDWKKGLLTSAEAARNYHEIKETLDPQHAEKLADEIQVAILEDWVKEQKAKKAQQTP